MLQALNEQKLETKSYMDRTDSSLRTLRDDTAGQNTAREGVERMERDVDALTENLKRLPVWQPTPTPRCGRARRASSGVGTRRRPIR